MNEIFYIMPKLEEMLSVSAEHDLAIYGILSFPLPFYCYFIAFAKYVDIVVIL